MGLLLFRLVHVLCFLLCVCGIVQTMVTNRKTMDTNMIFDIPPGGAFRDRRGMYNFDEPQPVDFPRMISVVNLGDADDDIEEDDDEINLFTTDALPIEEEEEIRKRSELQSMNIKVMLGYCDIIMQAATRTILTTLDAEELLIEQFSGIKLPLHSLEEYGIYLPSKFDESAYTTKETVELTFLGLKNYSANVLRAWKDHRMYSRTDHHTPAEQKQEYSALLSTLFDQLGDLSVTALATLHHLSRDDATSYTVKVRAAPSNKLMKNASDRLYRNAILNKHLLKYLEFVKKIYSDIQYSLSAIFE